MTDFQNDGRTGPDLWMRFMVANTNSSKCTGWHLHENAAENSKRVMAPPLDQPRTTRLPPTDHHYREIMASSSGRSCPALEARWPSEKRSTDNNSAKHDRGRHKPQRDKSTNCNEEPKQLEGNHHVTTLNGGYK